MKQLIIIILFFLTLNSFGQESKSDSLKRDEFFKQIEKETRMLDSLYSPLMKESNQFETACSNGEKSELEPQAGYILKNVAFDKNDTILISGSLPFKLPTGSKSVLFLHLQPRNLDKPSDCDSTNLVIITEINLPTKSGNQQVSNNTQLSIYTGYWYFPFEQKPSGGVTIKRVDNEIYKIELNMQFDFDKEKYRKIEAVFETRVLDRKKE